MAITSLAGVLAGLQTPQYFTKVNFGGTTSAGKPASSWGFGGQPGAGTFNSSAAGGTYSSTGGLVAGQIPHYDPGAGNSYLARLEVQSSISGQLLLCDRLWDDGGLSVTITTSQTINSVTWPSRDQVGGTNGVGVMVALELSVQSGAAAPTVTLGYTNSVGTAGQTATLADVTANSQGAGTFYRFGLAAGDRGVQSIQSVTLSTSWISGTMNLVAFRLLATVEITAAGLPNAVDALTGGFPQLFNGTVPFLVFIGQGNAPYNVSGQYVEAQG